MGRRILAVDPGIEGALVVLVVERDPPFIPTLDRIEDMPGDRVELARLVAELLPLELAVVERQQAFPRQGVVSTGRTMFGYGLILGVLSALQIETLTVRPRQWKAKYGLKIGDKKASLARARVLWPNEVDVFRRLKDNGRAEAALIGYAVLQWPTITRVDDA